jgi:hypothetical protein
MGLKSKLRKLLTFSGPINVTRRADSELSRARDEAGEGPARVAMATCPDVQLRHTESAPCVAIARAVTTFTPLASEAADRAPVACQEAGACMGAGSSRENPGASVNPVPSTAWQTSDGIPTLKRLGERLELAQAHAAVLLWQSSQPSALDGTRKEQLGDCIQAASVRCTTQRLKSLFSLHTDQVRCRAKVVVPTRLADADVAPIHDKSPPPITQHRTTQCFYKRCRHQTGSITRCWRRCPNTA